MVSHEIITIIMVDNADQPFAITVGHKLSKGWQTIITFQRLFQELELELNDIFCLLNLYDLRICDTMLHVKLGTLQLSLPFVSTPSAFHMLSHVTPFCNGQTSPALLCQTSVDVLARAKICQCSLILPPIHQEMDCHL